jgi:predicted small metal-binding protein
MSQCFGSCSVGTKTDRETCEFLTRRANELGVSNSELLRRLIDHYRTSRKGDLECPECGKTLKVNP